jgi:membrane-associated protease RseP (regulator of RpoE activity)
MSKLFALLSLLGLYTIATLIHLLGHMITGRLSGLKIERFNLFWISVFKFQTPFFPVEIGILPLGGSVKFSDDLETLALPLKWLVIISGPLLAILSALLVLPFDRAFPAFISGFGQSIYGAISPVAYGAPLLQTFFTEDLATSVFAAYGILALKLEALNLLPLPSLNGGQLVTAIIPNFDDSRWGGKINSISFLLLLIFFVSWGIALAVCLFR